MELRFPDFAVFTVLTEACHSQWAVELLFEKQAHAALPGLVHQVGTPCFSQDITAASFLLVAVLYTTQGRKPTRLCMGFS